ncbi:hypothetical protein NDU88_009294 [Pleurodeles waltl]|uniref:Uncharacterized protein n=1 Tax=Pleurodeles waltl TaxID=8319 RepID=A0AAV7PSC7_PLEWA|nr:hypothetical protein NDU88_009294 [Pleurodeles waltl]
MDNGALVTALWLDTGPELEVLAVVRSGGTLGAEGWWSVACVDYPRWGGRHLPGVSAVEHWCALGLQRVPCCGDWRRGTLRSAGVPKFGLSRWG